MAVPSAPLPPQELRQSGEVGRDVDGAVARRGKGKQALETP